jgi:hypothetical protein
VSPTTSGVEANDPYGEPAGSRYRQRTRSFATEAAEIEVSVLARVPLRFAFGSGHPAALVAPAQASAPAAVAAMAPHAPSSK